MRILLSFVLSWFLIGFITAYFGIHFRNLMNVTSSYMASRGEIKLVVTLGYISLFLYSIWTLCILIDRSFSGMYDWLAAKIERYGE